MRKLWLGLALVVALTAGYLSSQVGGRTEAGGKKSAAGPQIGHMVYFTLKEDSPAARAKLVEACKKYLSKHDGEVFFAAGTLCEELKRPVNDRDWQVGLHVVFANRKAHDVYQEHERHLQFIAENKDSWEKVRVFDSEIE